MKYLTLNLFVLLSFISCEVKENKTTSNLEKQKLTSKEVKKDSCEGISLLKIVEKSPSKNLEKFVLDSTFNFKIKDADKISLKEFNCLKMFEVVRKGFFYEKGKQVFGILDTLKYDFYKLNYGDYKFFLHSVEYDKNGVMKLFTTYSASEEGGKHSLNLFTIAPESKKIKNVYEIAFGMGDMGAVGHRSSVFINDSTFVQQEYHFAQNELTNNIKEDSYKAISKFLITKSGEIKLLDHNILINKVLQ